MLSVYASKRNLIAGGMTAGIYGVTLGLTGNVPVLAARLVAEQEEYSLPMCMAYAGLVVVDALFIAFPLIYAFNRMILEPVAVSCYCKPVEGDRYYQLHATSRDGKGAPAEFNLEDPSAQRQAAAAKVSRIKGLLTSATTEEQKSLKDQLLSAEKELSQLSEEKAGEPVEPQGNKQPFLTRDFYMYNMKLACEDMRDFFKDKFTLTNLLYLGEVVAASGALYSSEKVREEMEPWPELGCFVALNLGLYLFHVYAQTRAVRTCFPDSPWVVKRAGDEQRQQDRDKPINGRPSQRAFA